MGTERLYYQESLLQYERLFGLIGQPLSHSFSKSYFADKFKHLGLADTHFYELFPLATIEDLPQLQAWYPNLIGLNVTIPYKEVVQPYLSSIDRGASMVGAVNTIRIAGQEWTGYNTDVLGFRDSLLHILDGQKPDKALVLGTGGAAKAVQYVLNELDIKHISVSRTLGKGDVTYDQLSATLLKECVLIINTTPLGMSPRVDLCPALDYTVLGSEHVLFDLVYNPPETMFMTKGKEQGAKVENGYDMLVGQAEAAWLIWNT